MLLMRRYSRPLPTENAIARFSSYRARAIAMLLMPFALLDHRHAIFPYYYCLHRLLLHFSPHTLLIDVDFH